MKQIIAHILSVVLIYIPIMLVLAIACAALKKYGDRQRERDKINKAIYDTQYKLIQIYISDMWINDRHYDFITGCIEELEKFSWKNQEMTDALYRQLDKRFKPVEIHQMIEL